MSTVAEQEEKDAAGPSGVLDMAVDAPSGESDSLPREVRVTRHNTSVWRDGDFVSDYSSRQLRGAETALIGMHRDLLQGRVLELGCGAGRLSGHLIELGGQFHGIDLSPAMVDYCRAHYPGATFDTGDLRDLSPFPDESLDAVVATNNVLDVLDDAERREVLRDIRRILRPGGILSMSSHNREAIGSLRSPWDIRGARNAVRMAGKIALVPMRVYNRRKVIHLQRFEDDYALVNDDAHNFKLVHYYIAPGAQRRQLADAGFEVLETRRSDGAEMADDDLAQDCVEVHYVARRPGTDDS